MSTQNEFASRVATEEEAANTEQLASAARSTSLPRPPMLWLLVPVLLLGLLAFLSRG